MGKTRITSHLGDPDHYVVPMPEINYPRHILNMNLLKSHDLEHEISLFDMVDQHHDLDDYK